MSFDEAIPEHKIPTTERGKTHFDDERMTVMSTASTSSVGMTAAIIGTPSKMSTIERSEKPRANPSTYCDFCLGDARENKKTAVPEVKTKIFNYKHRLYAFFVCRNLFRVLTVGAVVILRVFNLQKT
jgi:hypothetical protein